ncbi:MAG: hypothetical protein A2033_12710, partial [Bacteroidetes bacterium GWA2_31_9]
RSNNKVFIEGKKYYLHTVSKGETLYSIAKAYNLETKDIAIENPEVFEGIRPSQNLKIPIISGKNSTIEEILSEGKYKIHKVEKGQTFYSISKLYNIDVNELVSLNKDAKDGLKIDQLLKIPNPEIIEVQTESANIKNDENIVQDNDFIYYSVKKKQTLYSISKEYDTDIEVIIKHNPELEKEGLKEGQIVKIPKIRYEDFEKPIIAIEKKDSIVKADTTNIENIISNALNNIPSITSKYSCDSIQKTTNKKVIKIGLLIPIFTNINTLVDIEKAVQNEQGFYPHTHFLDFYEGALLAIDTLRKQNISVELYVFDSKNDTATIKKILENNELKQVDLIIGTFYHQFLDFVSEFGKKYNIPIVSPLNSKDSFNESNHNTYTYIPDFNTQINLFSSIIADKYSDKNIICICSDTINELDIIKSFKSIILKDSLTKKISFNIVNYIKKEFATVEKLLKTDNENIIFIPSTDQAFVTNIVTKLSLKAERIPITLIGLPVWRKYDNIELDYLHKLKFHTFTNAFVDYNDIATINMIKEYRFMFKSEPSNPYSFMAYDIVNIFAKAINNYDKNFYSCVNSVNYNPIMGPYKFVSNNDNNGFINNSISVIKYDTDYNIIRINNNN